MSTILAIETCVPEASVVLCREGEILCHQTFSSDRNHNSMIFEALEQVLGHLDAGSLDLVLVGTGPGSYSGIRIGIAAGQGVALAHGCDAVGLGSFAGTSQARNHKPAIAIGDARRGVYFISKINEHGLVQAVELMDHERWMAQLHAEPEAALFTFDEPASLHLDAGLSGRVEKAAPQAPLLVDVWRGLSSEQQGRLMAAALSPTYLREPFTSKAKSGHPLIR